RRNLHVGAGAEVAREDERGLAGDVAVAAEDVRAAAELLDLPRRRLVDRQLRELAAVVEPGEEGRPRRASGGIGRLGEVVGDEEIDDLAGVGHRRPALPLLARD